MIILAGDVGGTKTNLALYRADGEAKFGREAMRSFPSQEYASLQDIVREFLREGPRADLACVGVAGPVVAGRSRLTNLTWTVDEEGVREASGAGRAYLINDLQATAYAVPWTPPGGRAVLQEGEADPHGIVAVVAAGTGLGMAFLVHKGDRYVPVATEGGHVDFAPRDEREIRLLRYLQARHGRVSVERVVSGPGIAVIHAFLRESEGHAEDPEILARFGEEDPTRVIVEAALAGRSPACREALAMFASLYGAAAGNFALQLLPSGGVVLGGGVAPAILPVLREGAFLPSFLDKGRFRELLARMRVSVLLDDTAALFGAAHYALAMEGR